MDYLDLQYDTIAFSIEDEDFTILVHSLSLGWLRLSFPLEVLAEVTGQWAGALHDEEG